MTTHFIEGKRAKAGQIPDALWNDHKAELTQRYQQGGRFGVAKALQWVQEQKFSDFNPNRRQVEYHLETKWALKVRPGEPQSTPLIVNALSTLQSPSPVDNADGDHSNSPEGAHTDAEANISIPPHQAWDPFFGTAENQRVSTSSIYSTQLEQMPRTSSAIRNLGNQKEDLEGSQESDNIDITISTELLKSTLESIHIFCSQEQIDQLAKGRCPKPPFASEDQTTIEEAAHFFDATLYESDAFILYFILLALHEDLPAPSKRRLRLLQSCALCALFATSPTNLEQVQILLSREVDRIKALPNTEMEQFILRTILCLVYGYLKKWKAYTNERWELAHSDGTFYDLDTFLTRLQASAANPDTRIRLDLSSYYILDFTFRSLVAPYGGLKTVIDFTEPFPENNFLLQNMEHSHSNNLKRLQGDFLRQFPGTFGFQNGAMKNECFRKCLDWCRKTLASQSRLPEQSRAIRSVVTKQQANLTGIYWLLWTQWQIEKGQLGGIPFWDADTERVMGIPWPKLLWELIELALTLFINENKRSRKRRVFDSSDLHIIQCAQEGTEMLARLSDEKLAEQFLNQFISARYDTEDPANPQVPKLQKSFFSTGPRKTLGIHKLATDDFVNTLSTSVFVAGMQGQSTPTEWNGVIPKPRWTVASFNPTMRSSYTGSTISSLRRRASKIARYSTASNESWRWISTGRTPTLDELSDSMGNMMRISAPILEDSVIDENAVIDELAAREIDLLGVNRLEKLDEQAHLLPVLE